MATSSLEAFRARMKARVAQFQQEREEKKRNPPESTACFCYVCGGPSTAGFLLKQSELQSEEYDDDDDDDDGVEGFYNDYCDCYTSIQGPGTIHAGFCRSRKGYEKKKISHRDLKWLGNVRMLSHFVNDDILAIETDLGDLEGIEGIELLTKMDRVHYGHNYGPHDTWTFMSRLKKPLGCLVHDTCLKILNDVHQSQIVGDRRFSLREALLVLEVSAKSRDSPEFDWGYEGAFGDSRRLEEQRGNPVENSEWTVMDPRTPVYLQPLVSKALKTSREAFFFRFDRSSSWNGANRLSSMPSELRMQVLEMLPMNSVLNLFLASSAFRETASNLPQRFWQSRIFTDFPWWQESSRESMKITDHGSFPFDKLFCLMREASKENIVLQNRRRIWKNCERLIMEIEARHKDIRHEAGNCSARISCFSQGSRRLTSYKAIAISRDFKEMPQAASALQFAGDEKDSNPLTELTAYFGAAEQIIGLEFRLMKESHGRLLGTRSASASKLDIQPGCVIVAFLLSFGSPESNEKERRIRGIGILTSDSPTKPAYILGQLNGEVVLQAMRAEPGMAIVGIAAEFNAETFTTIGVFSAHQPLTPIISESSAWGITFYTPWHYRHTQWLCRQPPLEWPLRQYFLESPSIGTTSRYESGFRSRDLRVLDPPIYFVNLRGRQLSQVKAVGDFEAKQLNQRYPTSLAFFFEDGSNEDIGGVINHDDTSNTQTIDFQVEQAEAIADMRQYYAFAAREDWDSYKLCGVQFMTTLGRNLSLGYVQTGEYVRAQGERPLNNNSSLESVCGIQVGFSKGVVECLGLAIWSP